MDVDAQAVDLYALLDSVLTVIEPTAAAKGVTVDVICARDLPRLQTDPRHLRQILLNLAANAVKFTERGSVALIARRDAASPDTRVAVTVEDTGVGIAAQDLERIFEEFEQVRPGGRGDSLQRGTGLGLTIARKLARLLGGEIGVESQPGMGSRFTLTLPIAGPMSGAVPPTAFPARVASATSATSDGAREPDREPAHEPPERAPDATPPDAHPAAVADGVGRGDEPTTGGPGRGA